MKGKKRDPRSTYVFRVTPEHAPGVYRVIELTEQQTLQHIHQCLQRSFGLRGNALYAFFLSGFRWDPETEYGGPGSGCARKANKLEIDKLEIDKGRVFRYLYNFELEHWFEVEWIEEQEEIPKMSYPRVLEEKGALPAEQPPLIDSLPKPLQRWVQRLIPILETRPLAGSKPRGPKEVQEAREILEELYDALTKRGSDTWHLLEESTDMRLADWLLSLPEDLQRRGFADEALDLCEVFATYAYEPYFLCERALVLASIGKRERALDQIRQNLTQYQEDPRVVMKSAEAFWRLDEVGPAERLFRKALDLAEDDISERERIVERLTVMLEENERTDEVIELIRAELDRG